MTKLLWTVLYSICNCNIFKKLHLYLNSKIFQKLSSKWDLVIWFWYDCNIAEVKLISVTENQEIGGVGAGGWWNNDDSLFMMMMVLENAEMMLEYQLDNLWELHQKECYFRNWTWKNICYTVYRFFSQLTSWHKNTTVAANICYLLSINSRWNQGESEQLEKITSVAWLEISNANIVLYYFIFLRLRYEIMSHVNVKYALHIDEAI